MRARLARVLHVLAHENGNRKGERAETIYQVHSQLLLLLLPLPLHSSRNYPRSPVCRCSLCRSQHTYMYCTRTRENNTRTENNSQRAASTCVQRLGMYTLIYSQREDTHIGTRAIKGTKARVRSPASAVRARRKLRLASARAEPRVVVLSLSLSFPTPTTDSASARNPQTRGACCVGAEKCTRI